MTLWRDFKNKIKINKKYIKMIFWGGHRPRGSSFGIKSVLFGIKRVLIGFIGSSWL
jgi:hypothetical protein